jgi:ribose-phosphate pyrophosphokinase
MTLNPPRGRLAVYANTNGEFYGRRIVGELNEIIREENSKKLRAGKTIDSELIEEEITLKTPVVKVFPSTDLSVTMEGSVRGEDAYIVQWFPMSPLMRGTEYDAIRNKEEFLGTVSAILKCGVENLSLVTPYAYAQRNDNQEGRSSIGSELFCEQLDGITKKKQMNAFCLDMHARQAVGYYHMINISMISVPIFKTYTNFLRESYSDLLKNAVIILPDAGSAKRGKKYSDILGGIPHIICNKERLDPRSVQAFFANDLDIKGKTGILVDDILSTGATAGDVIAHLKRKEGLKEAYWLMTHPELTDMKKIDDMYKKKLFEKIFLADTVDLPRDREYFIQVPTAKLMARLIYTVHHRQSTGPYIDY